jgi:ubiquinone/menaquinone biosynthesis C-methylase UbiE
MVAKIFLSLMDYPIFRKIVWKPFYEILAKKFRILDWHFMNYGYAFDPGAPVLHLRPNDEINRYPIQLYHYLATKTNIEGKEILEVGCGRGGGSRYINSYLNPRHVTALDIASNAIKWAKQHHKDKDLLFIQGDAQKLPFADGAFEVVLNVESCHAYPSVPKFLAEVKRILKPSGFFLCTDLRNPAGMVKLKETLLSSGMQLESEEDITTNVVLAIEQENTTKEKRINEHVSKWVRPVFRQFAGTKGSKIHKDLLSGALIYHSFVLTKK